MDSRILDNILSFTHFHGESILQGIKSLPPGNSFQFDLSTFKFQQRTYFDLLDLINVDEYCYWKKLGLEASTQELYTSLTKAVEKRLISDVPVASIASGG